MSVPDYELRSSLRQQARASRAQQEDKDKLSRRIMGAFMSLPEYAVADVVMVYVEVRHEVRTRVDLQTALDFGKTLVVPWCNDHGRLELFRLESLDELQAGMYGIPEPEPSLRHRSDKQIDVHDLDLVMVPGVGFACNGARLGHGKGYYDRLLADSRPSVPRIGVAFECQLFEHVPMASHDVSMHAIVTERCVYRCRDAASE